MEQDCAPGWLRMGGESARSCGGDGRWNNFSLVCGECSRLLSVEFISAKLEAIYSKFAG